MPKEFYTERDIEDLFKRGVMSLEVNDNAVLTELAYEKANRLGMKLVQARPDNPPGAPVRPYISQGQTSNRTKPAASAAPALMGTTHLDGPKDGHGTSSGGSELHQRIKSAVITRLGSQVDSGLLDVIIQRVLTSTGMK